MEKRAVVHGTFVIERNYPASVERVFAAFADASKKRRWFAEGEGSEMEEFEMDFRVGGNERTLRRFKPGTPFAGVTLVNESHYLDIVEKRRVVFAYTMTLGENRISASLATVEFLPQEKGSDLIFTDQGAYFEGADGPQMREGGWKKLLEGLAKEVARP
ncbi:MAG: SRPBCC family protein [Candidatus Acidiferrales bacterium]